MLTRILFIFHINMYCFVTHANISSIYSLCGRMEDFYEYRKSGIYTRHEPRPGSRGNRQPSAAFPRRSGENAASDKSNCIHHRPGTARPPARHRTQQCRKKLPWVENRFCLLLIIAAVPSSPSISA